MNPSASAEETSPKDPPGPGSVGGERLPRGRHSMSKEEVVQSQRERLVAAMVLAASEQGYAATSVADVLRRARVSRATG